MKDIIYEQYDVVIIGGGMSGVCAAIVSARHGAKTVLVQDRSVLGGNASSEIRMHICGADWSGRRPHARETGILEEICLEHKHRNPNHSFSIFDTILWEKTRYQPGLTLYLNTHCDAVEVRDGRILSVKARQMTTEKWLCFQGTVFIDATGDGTVGYLAGAAYRLGREGKAVFGEQFAPDEDDLCTMGNSLMFKAVDTGAPVRFEKPAFAYTYTEEDLKHRDHHEITSGYWWIELGGKELSTITDGEEIRDELLKSLYGVWDHIKNGGDHGAENYDLDWVQFLPGKRESRRLEGAYILREQDLLAGRVFEDAVCYGGWPMDMHIESGLRSTELAPTHFIHLDGVYTIPYRSLYSKNIGNLMLAGRAISVSHMAHGSTRDMGTTSVVGQAVGTAAAMAIEKGVDPAALLLEVRTLQQRLLKDDCYIPGFQNEDPADAARRGVVACSGALDGYPCEQIIDGIARQVGDVTHAWVSEPLFWGEAWIEIALEKPIVPGEVVLFFDSDLSKVITITLSKENMKKQYPQTPPMLAKDYDLVFYYGKDCVYTHCVRGNYYRHRKHFLEGAPLCDRVRLRVLSTHGHEHARLFEMRVYPA